MKHISQVIQSVRLTEKSSMMQEIHNEVTLVVAKKANKFEIKQAFEQAFGKKAVSVRTANYLGKERRKRRSDAGRTASWKKAIVRLEDGETMDLI